MRHIARMQPQRILDVATGTAGVAIALAKATDAEIVGVDISEPMLEAATKTVDAAGLDRRIRLQRAGPSSFRSRRHRSMRCTFTYLLRYVADPAATLKELTRVLRPAAAWPASTSSCRHRLAWRLQLAALHRA